MRTPLSDGTFGDIQPLPYPISELIQIMNDEVLIQEVEDKSRQNPYDPLCVLTPELKDIYLKLEQVRDCGVLAQQKMALLYNEVYLGLAPEAVEPRDLV